jgi:hypothetical protein
MTPEMLIPVDEFEALHDRIRMLESRNRRLELAIADVRMHAELHDFMGELAAVLRKLDTGV